MPILKRMVQCVSFVSYIYFPHLSQFASIYDFPARMSTTCRLTSFGKLTLSTLPIFTVCYSVSLDNFSIHWTRSAMYEYDHRIYVNIAFQAK